MVNKAAFFALLIAFTHSTLADFNDGVVALLQGDNEKALSTFVPLAETSDHAYAQYFLGRMYQDGRGVTQNSETAAQWYRKAAEKGIADAQFRLGNMYEAGEGVPSDMEYAYGWYRVGAHLGNANAVQAADSASEKMTDDELIQAKKLARKLINDYGKTPKDTARTQ